MVGMRTTAAAWLTACLVWGGTPAVGEAVPVPIANPGFEDPVTATVAVSIGSWTTITGVSGVWNVNDYDPGPFWTSSDPAPEGKQVAFVSAAPLPGAPSTISQILADSVLANSLYTLTGYIGHPIGFGTTPDPDTVYTVGLFANNTELASIPSVTGPEGTFVPFTLTFDSTGSGLVGQLLEIRLSSSQPQTAFDAIGLNVEAVPEPGSLALLALGAAFVARRVRRNRTEP